MLLRGEIKISAQDSVHQLWLRQPAGVAENTSITRRSDTSTQPTTEWHQWPIQNHPSHLSSPRLSRSVASSARFAPSYANVFLAIHEQHGLAGPKGPPAALTSLQADSAGRLATHLVLELMQACGLDYSLSVFGPEANVKGMLAERGQLAEALGLKGGVKADEPLLVQFVRAALPGGGGVSPPPATAEAAIAQQAAIGGGGVSKQVSSSVSMEPAVNTTSISSAAPLAAQPVSKTTSDGGASKPQDKPDNSNTASAPLRAAGPPRRHHPRRHSTPCFRQWASQRACPAAVPASYRICRLYRAAARRARR